MTGRQRRPRKNSRSPAARRGSPWRAVFAFIDLADGAGETGYLGSVISLVFLAPTPLTSVLGSDVNCGGRSGLSPPPVFQKN
jgi:hypothetical protein